jgi:hypothetical protein
LVDAIISDKPTASIFRAEVVMLGSGGFFLESEKRKIECVHRHFIPEDGDSRFPQNVDVHL